MQTCEQDCDFRRKILEQYDTLKKKLRELGLRSLLLKKRRNQSKSPSERPS
jgi:hypothetical protein